MQTFMIAAIPTSKTFSYSANFKTKSVFLPLNLDYYIC